MKTHKTIILLLVSLPLILSACAASTPAPSTATNIPITTTPASGSASAEVNVEFGSGPFIFPDTQEGLADLTSYKATLTLTFDGTNAGQSEQWSKVYSMLAVKDPAARQLTLEKTGNISDPATVFMAESNGVTYEWRTENDCSAAVVEEGTSLGERLELAGFLSGVTGADEAGSETVNAVVANHYTFDERAFGQPDSAQSNGELWIANEGGYIVKYLLTTKGNADYFGEGIEGTLTWDYELTDVNQPVTITLPDSCPGGLVNVPTLIDASDVLRLPGLLTYHTATSLADAAAFYQQELPKLGWELDGEPALADTSALLDYVQGAQTLSVIITADETGTTVNITLGKSDQ